MPCISAVGNIRPVSTTTMRPSYSMTVMFLPISPRPPRGSTRRVLLGNGKTHSLGISGRSSVRDGEADCLEAGPHRGALLVVTGDERQAHVVVGQPHQR